MKVLVIGSGPIVIGQAAEFDYAGTQACKSLKEEGHEVVLINSNPATIMTDPGVADALYIEPLNTDFCERVIARERPDALLPTLGGQTGLNLATQLHDEGILERYNVKLLGTPLSAIRKAEDREQFRALMHEIKEPVPESWIIETPEQLEAVLDVVPYPCIIRPAYTLGGTGGGIANTREELLETGLKGLKLSMRSQIMVERSLLGWKEIEYEVMRDSAGNCITVCNMENFDPMGVHTGDSIVVAPSQTMSDIEYHMMRTASLKIINALGIEGGCNVQMALNPDSFDYYIIEVNPRVSRSSALASKATGYPIARVAAKIAVGLTLDQIDNQVTGTTKACFEPALDYIVVKIPRWPFDKFASGDRSLFTQMKATGEVMAIDRTFESAFMKAIRGLEVKQKDLRHPKFQEMEDEPLANAIQKPTDERLWAIAEGLRRGWGVERVNKLSRVDKWFLRKIENLLGVEQLLLDVGLNGSQDLLTIQHEALLEGKTLEKTDIPDLSDQEIVSLANESGSRAGWARTEAVKRGLTDKVTTISRLSALARSVMLENPGKSVLSSIIESAFLLGFPSNTIQDLLGISKPVAKATTELVTAYEQLDSDQWVFDVHELEDLLLQNPYESAEDALEERSLFLSHYPRFDELYRNLHQDLYGISESYLETKNRAPIWWIQQIVEEVNRQKVMPVFKMVDTCAGEFESQTPYYYGTFEQEDDALHALK